MAESNGNTSNTSFRSVMVFWVYSKEQYATSTPLMEIAEHAQLHGFNDEPVDVLCLHGFEFIPPADLAALRGRNFILQDVSSLYRSIAVRYPNLRKRYSNHFFECFLRWIVIKEFYQGAPVLAWDADIFFNDKLSRIHAEFAGSTFTSSSTCFVALSDPGWLAVYEEQLNLFEQNPQAFLFTAFMHLNKLQNSGHDFHTSFFGPKLEASLNSVETWNQTFDWTPEEMFVDFLVRTERLPYHLAKGRSQYFLCAQPLLLPRLAWTHPLGAGFDVEAPDGAGLTQENGYYQVGDRPLAFLHFQGALFRACATHQIFHRILQNPVLLHDEYCRAGRRTGVDVPAFMASQRTETLKKISEAMSAEELRRGWGNPYSERDVARNYLIKSDILGVLQNYGQSSGEDDNLPESVKFRVYEMPDAFPKSDAIPYPAQELNVWLDEYLKVCGEHRVLVCGPGAAEIVGNLLGRGIDACGVETFIGAPVSAHSGRCIAGTLGELPIDRTPFASAIFIGAFENLDEDAFRRSLETIRAAVTGSIYIRLFRQDGDFANRAWVEQIVLENGFRKHPLRHLIQPYEAIEREFPFVLCFERISESGEVFDGQAGNEALRESDPTRSSSRLSDGLLARYELAAALIRPWDTVLDLDCGNGGGTHLLHRASRGGRFIAINDDAAAIQYAHEHFAAKPVEFHHRNQVELLAGMADGAVDLVICSALLADPDAVDSLLPEMNRLLAPGGRLVFALNPDMPGEGKFIPFDKLESDFICEAAYRLCGNDDMGAARSLQKVSLLGLPGSDADAWIIVAMKNPLAAPAAPYRETAFRHVAEGGMAPVLKYPDFYEQPWILHSLVHAGIRLNSPGDLTEAAWHLLLDSPETSAEAGAALCLLLYRAIEGTLVGVISRAELVQQAERYLQIAGANAHQLRWQVSLAYALGQLAMRDGELGLARLRFGAVAEMDVYQWGPSLATKTTEAIFLAGWLAWCANDLKDCEFFWKRGIEFGKQLLAHPLEETLLNAEFPSLFDYGDGMRELVYALENVTMCTNGLHALRLREQGISTRPDLIFNTFRTQRDSRERLLRQAQFRVGKLCRDIDGVRTELSQRTNELDGVRAEKELFGNTD